MKSPEGGSRRFNLLVSHLPAHAVAFDPEPETICFRGQTLAIVRHFFEISSQLGRLPSILGREFFRAKVTHQTVPSFEDRAVFVHDVERALMKLDSNQVEIIAQIGLYDVSHEEAAVMLHRSQCCISQRYAEAIARLTQIFLDTGLLNREKADRRQAQMKGRKLPASMLPPRKPCGSVHQVGRSAVLSHAQVHRMPQPV